MELNDEQYYKISEIILTYRTIENVSSRPQINKSQDAFKLFRRIWDDGKLDFIEEAKLLLLNRANYVLGVCNISSGGTTESLVEAKIVFAAALKANASSIILAHNHPSGNVLPSVSDRIITSKLSSAGELLGIVLRDHLIIGRDEYYSISADKKYVMT